MHNYGKAFRTIRLIKGIALGQAADGLNIDERTLRKIEDGETDLITPRFDQMLSFYAVEYPIVFELVKEHMPSQNIIQSITGDSTVVNQNQPAPMEDKDKYISALLAQIEQMQLNDKFQKEWIERLMTGKQ
jgi:transcriptional regulator with XRE-family HTH domain